MQSRQPLSGFRLIKRRVQVIKRPAIWGSALVIIATVIVFMDYWRGYSQINLARQNIPEGSIDPNGINLDDPNLLLSDEDRAIAADIDTLPLLLNDFSAPKIEATPEPEVKPSDSASSLPSPLPTTLPGFPQYDESPRSSLENPFDLPKVSAQPSSGIGAAPLVQQVPVSPSLPLPSPMGGLSVPTPSVASSDPLGATPLQQALQRHQQQIPLEHVQGLPLGSVPFQSTSQSPSGASGVPDAATLGVERYRIPAQTSPPLGTTGYTLPPTLRVGTSTEQPSLGSGSVTPLGLPDSTAPQPSPQSSRGLPPMAKP